jgi:hypothetical protein
MRWRWPIWLTGGLLVLAVVLGIRVLRRSTGPGGEPAHGAPVPAPVASAEPPAPRPTAATPRPRRARIPIPRLRAAPAPTAAPAPPPAAPALERSRGHLFDRRADPGPDSDALRVRLRERLEAVDDAVEVCLARHAGEDPSLAAGVMLVFTLDAGGLQEVWIEDHPDVAAGPLACLSEAVHGVDWNNLTREPIQISRRMRTRPDGGPGR